LAKKAKEDFWPTLLRNAAKAATSASLLLVP